MITESCNPLYLALQMCCDNSIFLVSQCVALFSPPLQGGGSEESDGAADVGGDGEKETGAGGGREATNGTHALVLLNGCLPVQLNSGPAQWVLTCTT